MRRSARLRSVMLRATKMQPWKRGSSADITEPDSDTGIVWPDCVRIVSSSTSLVACSMLKFGRSRSEIT